MNIFFSILFSILSFLTETKEDTLSVKCMIQMIEYRGEGAYFAISVVDSEEEYIKTLYVMGNDKTWFSDMKTFWKYLRSNNLYTDKAFYSMVNGISGATISGGQRRIFPLKIPLDLLNKGYRLRFETAVEDKGYYKEDVAFYLNQVALNKSYKGNGFISEIKFSLPKS